MLFLVIDLLSGALVPLLVVLLIFGRLKKVGAGRLLLLTALTLYFAELFDVVGIPYLQTAAWKPVLNAVPFSDLFREGFSGQAMFQFAANIVLFLPFGFLLPVIWRSFRRLSTTALAGALTSLCIELLQLFCARVSAADDLLMNTLGAVLGYLIAAGCLKKRWNAAPAAPGTDGRRDRRELLLVAAAVFVSVLLLKYPIGSLIYALPLFG